MSQNIKVIHKDNRFVLYGVGILCLLIIITANLISTTVTAQRKTERYKRVTSVEVKKGDSLWSIASDYMTDEYSNINEYIKEIKDSNGLVSDTIHIGNYIIVPYYTDAGYSIY